MQNTTNGIESSSTETGTEIRVLEVVPVPTYIDFDNQVWIEGSTAGGPGQWEYDEGTDGTFVEWTITELRDSDGTKVSRTASKLFTPYDLANLLKAARTVAAGHGLGRGFKCLAKLGLVRHAFGGNVLTVLGELILSNCMQAQGLSGIAVSRQADSASQSAVNRDGQVIHDRWNLKRPDGVVGSVTKTYRQLDGRTCAGYHVEVWRLSQHVESLENAPTTADRLYASRVLTIRHRLIWADGFDRHLLHKW